MNKRPTIDLAPGHKLGLIATSPVLLAGGIVGLGEAVPTGVDTHKLGGVVVGPIQRHPRAGSAPPRLAEAPGQFVLEHGLQNRGLTATLKRYARYWARLGCPVIVQLADTEAHFLGHVTERLVANEHVSGFELLVPRHFYRQEDQERAGGNVADWLTRALHAINQSSDLPIWVKLPLDQAVTLAPVAIAAGAVGLVVGQPPLGTLAHNAGGGQSRSSTGNIAMSDRAMSGPLSLAVEPLLRGTIFGPSTFPLMLTVLVDLVQRKFPAAIIACGGIHTVAQAQQALDAGATALQLDSVVWIEPGIVDLICEGLGVPTG